MFRESSAWRLRCVIAVRSWKSSAARRRIALVRLHRYRSLVRIKQVISILVAASVIHAGPVAAYLCMAQQTPMAACCPESPDSNHQHGSAGSASPSDALTFCCPDGAEALPAGTSDLPDAVLVVENVVLVVGATGRDHSPAIAHVRPWAQGPPIYLATQRLRN